MSFAVKNTNFGKLVLSNKRVLPMGDYSLPVKVLSLTDVIAIHANSRMFVVETTKHFYIFNAETCKCICKRKQKPNFHIFTDYIVLYDSIYDKDIALDEDYPIIDALNNGNTVCIAANNAIIRSSSGYFYYSSPIAEPVLISQSVKEGNYTYKLNSNLIVSIHPSSSGKFIIRTTNNKILLFELLFDEDRVNGKLDPYCMWLSKLMDGYGFSSTNIKIYPTNKQFILTDNVNMFLFPLGDTLCLTPDGYADQIKKCTYPIQSNIITVTGDAQISLDTNGDVYVYDFINNLSGDERRKLDINVKTISAFDNGFYADAVYYPMFVTLATEWNTQQIKNYTYTMNVCAGLRNPQLLNYLYRYA